MFLSDLGSIFDGAHLLQNIEALNPGRTLSRKYANPFRDIDKGDRAIETLPLLLPDPADRTLALRVVPLTGPRKCTPRPKSCCTASTTSLTWR